MSKSNMPENSIPTHEIKESVLEMMVLVKGQVENTLDAIVNFDKDICQEVLIQEKRVNALDLKIDKDSERIMALFSPVAIDLRCIISGLNINTFLERIGDNAQGICNYILEMEQPFASNVLEKTCVVEQLEIVLEMIDCMIESYNMEDISKATRSLTLDKLVDKINKDALDLIIEIIKNDMENMKSHLFLLSTIRKIERIGDLITNVAEETIFYLDAKVLKHKKKKTLKYIDKHIEE